MRKALLLVGALTLLFLIDPGMTQRAASTPPIKD